MDPISQGILGTLASQTVSKKKSHLLAASIVGWLGGMAADLDTLIRSQNDPLLFLEYHRHFTHSLLFIPLGGLIVSFLLWLIFKNRFIKAQIPFKTLWLYTSIGYATHALLDACTSYGTLLLWPLTSYRFAFDIIAIIDLFFTIPLIILGIITLKSKKKKYAFIAFIYAFSYLGFGYYQREKAVDIITQIAQSKNHQAIRIEAKPTLGNLWLWRGIYETKDRFYAQAIYLGLFSEPKIYPGLSSQKITNINDFFPILKSTDIQYQDINRFRHFSKDYLSLHPNYPNVIGDFRYALLPNSNIPLWGIEIDPDSPNQHVNYLVFRKTDSKRIEKFWKMLKGQ